MRVIIANTLYRWKSFGGAEVSVELLVEGLAKSGHDVMVLCLDPESDSVSTGPYGEQIIRIKIPNIYWQYAVEKRSALNKILWHGLEIWNPRTYYIIKKIINQFQPDIFHTNVIAGFSPSIWSAALISGVPCIHTLRDFYSLCFRVTQYRGGKKCEKICANCRLVTKTRRSIFKHLSAVVGISDSILKQHLRFTDLPEIRRVIPNPVPGNKAERPERRNSELRVGIIGRLAPEKGVLEFVESFCENQALKASLLIAGDGDEEIESRIRKKAENDPRLIFNGRMPREKFFHNIDLLVVPSRWNEPFGRIVVEGYSFGVPCMARALGGLKELVDAGSTGWLFEEDREAIRILESVASNPESIQPLAQKALEKSKEFSIDAVAGKYADLYRSVIGEGCP